MIGQIALDVVVSIAIAAAFALLLLSAFAGMNSNWHRQLGSLSNSLVVAQRAINYSISPEQQFGILGST